MKQPLFFTMTNMYYCYILYSKIADKYYVGFTTGSIEERIIKHNQSFYGSRYSSISTDWELYYLISCNSQSQALKIERHIKSMKSRKYIENLYKFPEIGEKLLIKYGASDSADSYRH